jgi:signal transduction histidine kinase
VFKQVEENGGVGAMATLTGERYMSAKSVYASSMRNVVEAQRDALRQLAGAANSAHDSALALLAMSLAGAAVAFGMILLSSWRQERQLSFALTDAADARATLEERVRARTAELQEARDAALAAAKAKTDFLAMMSHEIRTPMNGVIGMANVLLEGELLPQTRLQGETIRDSAEALL